MIIVSQDRKMLINFNSIVSVYVIKNCVSKDYVSEEDKGYNIDFATNEEINFVLATYKTEERAKEVLQQIACRYSSEEMYKRADSKTQEVLTRKYLEIEIIPYIFEMPEK